jgi:hypothetical protein
MKTDEDILKLLYMVQYFRIFEIISCHSNPHNPRCGYGFMPGTNYLPTLTRWSSKLLQSITLASCDLARDLAVYLL